MKSDYYKLYVWDQARMDDFIDVEGRRVCKEMVAELAKHWARAEGRRLAEQAAKAIAKRAEKARKTKEKAEKRLRVADDLKREKKLMLEERAAEQLHIATQKKATRAPLQKTTIKLAEVVNEEEKMQTRGKKRAQANANRAHRKRDEAEAKRNRREAIVNKKVGALEKQTNRQREHVNKVLRQGHPVAAVEQIRTELGNRGQTMEESSPH
ncbi:hypothetical protein MJO28_008603, partial [Puccinia striiformis f. sp. tritici]